MIKEFVVAAENDETEVEKPVEFKIKGGDEVYRAYRPTPGQTVMLFARLDKLASVTEQTAAMIDYFFDCLDEQSHRTLARKLMDRDDPFEIEDISEINTWLMEEWGARPTQPSSDSSPSRANGGRKSTGNSRRAASTRSVSASTVSST